MILNFCRSRSAIVLFLAIALSSCGSPAASPLVTSLAGAGRVAPYQHSGRSWMATTSSGQALLYVTDGVQNVFVYTYPEGQLVGTLTGFISPLGECVDAAGDVFIVTYTDKSGSSSMIYEYAHGGTQPIATLNDPNPGRGCAVDPRTGDLAVSGDGLALFKNASGKPTLYNSSEFAFYYCGYDPRGNLYLSASGQYLNRAYLVRFVAGSGQFEQLDIGKDVNSIGDFWPSVLWDGKHMTISSALLEGKWGGPAAVYRLRISGNNATIVGTTTLRSNQKGQRFTGQLSVWDKKIVGITYHNNGQGRATYWSYPKGGRPKGSIDVLKAYGWLMGIVISPASSTSGRATRG